MANSRFPMLDCLRASAVALVIWRHVPEAVIPSGLPAFIRRGGTVGVDLFFVLSGFLIGGLLFRELQRKGQISIGHFYMRRGFKIYPAFYCFVAATVALMFATNHPIDWRSITSLSLFAWNYTPDLPGGLLWGHAWSLCVEEHFYLALPVLLAILANTGSLRLFPLVTAGIALLCFGMRFQAEASTCSGLWLWTTTHLRIDSLMCGVLIAYFYCYWPQPFVELMTRLRTALAIVGCLLLLPIFIYDTEGNRWIMVGGFTLFYLGSACLVCWALTFTKCGPVAMAIGWVGSYSYSIYLWHFAALHWFMLPFFGQYAVLHPAPWIGLYVASSLTVGIVAYHLVEQPSLWLRDKFFPSRSGQIA